MQYTRGRVLLSDAAPILSLTATDRRPSAQTAAVPQRPPFAVSMHVGTPDRIHPVPKPIVRRAVPPPKPEVVRKSSLPSSRIPKAVKGRPRQSIAVPAVHLPLSYPGLCSPPFVPAARSKIPVLPRRRSPDVFFALRTSPQSAPRTTPYRIPRFKCTPSCLADVKFLDRQPQLSRPNLCPSHTLMVQVRRLARRVSVVEDPDLSQSPRAEMVEDSIVSETEVIFVIPVCHYTVVRANHGDQGGIGVEPSRVHGSYSEYQGVSATHASPASTDSYSLRKTKPTTNTTEDNSIMRSFIGELKSRLSWTKTATVPKADSFVLWPASPDVDRPTTTTPITRRRASCIRLPSRRPLAPIQNRFFNGAFIGKPPPVSPKDMHLHHPTSTDAFPFSDDNDNCNPPGADFTVTELVTTAFGTRRVRRMVIPPLAEGARLSRDPRVVAELKFLRAKQKVGGGAKADEVQTV
ncbi:hypothetical protein B0H14DRAFT_3864872 [Mycena olivaceomarginata]|nr:hypothetical protein B0H14DRAFT_3864872 [Mycena olivaceomarginata]